MDVRSASTLSPLALARVLCVVVGTGTVVNGASAQNTHPGQVLQAADRSPLTARATAWQSHRQSGMSGDCPEYGNSIDSTISSSENGRFEVKVAENFRTYTMVYCANNYYSRVDRLIANRNDGSSVVPSPALVVKRDQSKKGEETQAAWIATRTTRSVVYFLNELAYLRSINEAAFDSAFDQYLTLLNSTDDRAAVLVNNLRQGVITWASP